MSPIAYLPSAKAVHSDVLHTFDPEEVRAACIVTAGTRYTSLDNGTFSQGYTASLVFDKQVADQIGMFGAANVHWEARAGILQSGAYVSGTVSFKGIPLGNTSKRRAKLEAAADAALTTEAVEATREEAIEKLVNHVKVCILRHNEKVKNNVLRMYANLDNWKLTLDAPEEVAAAKTLAALEAQQAEVYAKLKEVRATIFAQRKARAVATTKTEDLGQVPAYWRDDLVAAIEAATPPIRAVAFHG